MLITAVLVQRSSGGNLAEILDQSAETLRERERLRGDVRTLTAQQRLSGYVLAVYPVLVGLGLLVIAPDTYSLLFTETIGRTLLGVAFGLQAAGFLVIRRLIKIEI
jgi:tight adherence protein B